jgi:predicted ester cyclase
LAPNYFDHTSHVDREGLKQLMTMAFKAFHDFQETIEDIIAEGDKVWARITFTGTHTGEWMGLAPTGKTVTTEMVDIFRIENGKLIEYRDVNNNMDFLNKLGLIEYTEQGKQFFQQE